MAVCKKCGGYGYTQVDGGHYGIPQAVPCECQLNRALDIQAEKAFINLSKYPVKKSVLTGKITESLVITAEHSDFLLHLRGALHKHKRPQELVKVVSDAECMSAWLGSIKLSGMEVADPDFQANLKVFSLSDLAEPPKLLVINTGIKMARNSAMSEVLHETLTIRQFLNKPTWVVQPPDRPIQEGHIAWSRPVEDALDGWERISLVGVRDKKEKAKKSSGLSITSVGSTDSKHPNLPSARHKTLKL